MHISRLLVIIVGIFCLVAKGGGPGASSPDVKSLLAKLGDKDGLVRQEAIGALAAIRPVRDEVVAALTAALGDPEWEVQGQAARNLGRMGPTARKAAPALTELTKRHPKEKSSVREDALLALVMIGRVPFEDEKWIRGLKPEARPLARMLVAIRTGDLALLKRLYSARLTLWIGKETGWDQLMKKYERDLRPHPVCQAPPGKIGFVPEQRGADTNDAKVVIVLDGKRLGDGMNIVREGDEWFLDEM